MSNRDGRGGWLMEACVTLLLAAMALYGTVQIISAMWMPLCILAAIIGLFWLSYIRFNRW